MKAVDYEDLSEHDRAEVDLFTETIARKGAGGRYCRACWGGSKDCDLCGGSGVVGGGQVSETRIGEKP